MEPMTRIVKLAAILLVVLLIGISVFALFFDVNQFRPTIQAQLESSLKRKVVLGPMSLGFFPPALKVQNVAIGENPALVSASELSVRPALLPLLRKEVEIQSLRLVKPVFELVETSAGHWNYETPGDSSKSNATLSIGELVVEDGRVAMTALGSPREVYDHIGLVLNDYAPGRTFSANLSVEMPQNLKLDADLKGRNDDDTLTVDSLAAKLGKLTLTGAGKLSSKATDFALKVEKSSIADLAQAAAAFGKAFSPGMKVAGDLSADVKLTGPSDHLVYNGTINVSSLEVSAQNWAQPVRIPEAKLELTPTTVKTNTFTVESGATKLTASATVNGYASDSGDFEARLSAPSAQLEELLHMASIYGGENLAGVSATGKASLDVTVKGKLPTATNKEPAVNYSGSGSLTAATVKMPTLTKPLEISDAKLQFSDDRISVDRLALGFGATHATGKVSVRGFARPEVQFDAAIDKVDVDEMQKAMVPAKGAAGKKEPLAVRGGGNVSIGQLLANGMALSNVKAKCTLQNGVIELDPLTADVFGGHQSGTITVDTRPAVTTIAIKTKVDRVDANQLLSSTTSLKQKIFGLMAANGNIRIAPKPGEDIARSLNGTLGLQLTKGKLAGVNLVNEMAGVAKLLGFRQQGEAVTNILGLTGNLQFTNGTAQTNDLKMTFDGGSMSAAGTVNLVDQALQMKVTTIMSKGFSDQFAGGKVGGLLTSALTNKNGELVIPALVSGTMAAPRFAPDAAEIAKLKLQGIAPGFAGNAVGGVVGAVQSGKGAKGIFDAITGRGQPQGQQSRPEDGTQKDGAQKKDQPASPADALIDLLKKRKQ